MSVSTDPQTLCHEASAFSALTPHQLEAVVAYCLAVKNGGSIDPNTLLHEASAFNSLTGTQLKSVTAYLLLSLVNK